jgi:glycine cleavage system H protein
MYPADYLYTKEHEWIRVEGDIATIGITEFAQQELGDVVFIELPEPGKALTAHQAFGTIESVKAVSDLYAPASGEVVEVNDELKDNPEKVNSDPHGAAWLLKVRLGDKNELGSLLKAADYEKLVAAAGK